MAGVKRKFYTESDDHALHKELDEVSCPICMDHPHNAVLLLCSSHDKGCRSYICDTSYRHSNCLDRFKKLQLESTNRSPEQNPLPVNVDSSNNNASDVNLRVNLIEDGENHDTVIPVGSSEGSGGSSHVRLSGSLDSDGEGILEIGDIESLRRRLEQEESRGENLQELRMSLKCPLCRGAVLGWKVVEEARRYLNMKRRSCSRESCSFVGNYKELRQHARRVHPTTRPSNVDPSRERAWRRLEHQREYGDIVSAIRSAMPGAVVVGDYVIENGDRIPAEMENSNAGDLNAPWWTTFFLFQMIGSLDRGRGGGGGGSRANRSRAWLRHQRSSERRYLWGENLLGLQDDGDRNDDDLRVLSDAGDDLSSVLRRRRRLARSRSGEDRS